MAKFLGLTFTPSIADGGTNVVSQGWSVTDQEIEEFQQATYRLGASGSKFIAVDGTDITGKTDPQLLPLSVIQGFSLESTEPVTIKVDGAAAGVQTKQAVQNGMIASSLEIEGAGQAADVKLIVWGVR